MAAAAVSLFGCREEEDQRARQVSFHDYHPVIEKFPPPLATASQTDPVVAFLHRSPLPVVVLRSFTCNVYTVLGSATLLLRSHNYVEVGRWREGEAGPHRK